MTIQEFAKATGLHPGTVKRYIAAGMPCRRVPMRGIQWRWEIDPAAAEAWMIERGGANVSR
jgi:hypothetical protein